MRLVSPSHSTEGKAVGVPPGHPTRAFHDWGDLALLHRNLYMGEWPATGSQRRHGWVSTQEYLMTNEVTHPERATYKLPQYLWRSVTK
ncbi:hypothetical protein BaRGS_00036804 [Batillaria attramentaria]|uniref:Uncharacterized protein n=1 Tax=Batillaria attramentaria TaxID=370345 RepID=A0ABD0JAR1_9CAEN